MGKLPVVSRLDLSYLALYALCRSRKQTLDDYSFLYKSINIDINIDININIDFKIKCKGGRIM